MMNERLRACRTLLFLPASNPRAIDKARTLDADMVILDCEDAVRAEDKAEARAAAVEAVAQGFGDRLCAIRINAAGTQWHDEDVAAVAASSTDCLVAPKIVSRTEAERLRGAGKPLIAMIESAAAVLAAHEIAGASEALLVGANDLAFDLSVPHVAGRPGLAHCLQAIVVAARASGIAVFDGVYNRLDDAEGLAEECLQGKAFGFDGKSVIHPTQIEIASRVFSPSGEEVEAARRLIAVATGGAERFEGRMIEEMHVTQARALLAKGRGPV